MTEKMTEPVVDIGLASSSLVELTVNRLRREILAGALVPGERLVEEQVTRRFGISRAPLREALRLLGEQGLVEHLPRRGSRVTDLSPVEVEQLFGIRGALEQHAIELTFPMAQPPTEATLAPVREWLDRMRQADADGDQLRKDDAHRAFHAAIVSLAGNRQLDLALEPILWQLQRPMALNLRRETQELGPEEGIRRHERLIRALETNDREVILRELRDHGTHRFLNVSAS